MFVHALKTRHHDHMTIGEVGADVLLVYADDACLGMRTIGEYLDLCAGVTFGLHAFLLQRHGQQAYGHLFAGGNHYIEFARIRMRLNLPGQRNQAIGLAAHRGYHHHNLVPLRLVFCYAVRHAPDTLRRTDRRAAIFLNNQCHDYVSQDETKVGGILPEPATKNEVARLC